MSETIDPAVQERMFFAAILHTVAERGCGHRPIQEVTTGDIRAMARACMAKLPKPRPPDQTPPGPKPVRIRPSEARDRSVVPDPPDGAAGGCGCKRNECGLPSVGWRFYVDQGWLPVCSRHMTGAGATVRRGDAGRSRFRADESASSGATVTSGAVES